jgi:molybdopterin converting factor small subunit
VATVTIRYWAAAKHAAGIAEESVDARTLADALGIVRQRHSDSSRFSDVLGLSSVLIDEKPVGRHAAEIIILNDKAMIEVLPPFAGG